MNFSRKPWGTNFFTRAVRNVPLFPNGLVWLSLTVMLCGFSVPARSQQTPAAAEGQNGQTRMPADIRAPAPRQSPQQPAANIRGTVVDPTGAAIVGALVTLVSADTSVIQKTPTGSSGQFSFDEPPASPFRITITAEGFATRTISGVSRPGESYSVGEIRLPIAAAVSEVRVGPGVAEEQIKVQEKQRVLGVIPNFYVSYIANAVPLTPKQKFELAWKSMLDPVTFALTGAAAGIEQEQGVFSGYGSGAEGYAKRYGATYADVLSSTFIGGAILPSLLKQDPRYFFKGSGSRRSRILYAIATSVICKGDDGRWEANYSGILGSLAGGGISNLYYPSASRGAALVFENTGIEIGETAAANILQEFVIPRFTRRGGHRRREARRAHRAIPSAKPAIP